MPFPISAASAWPNAPGGMDSRSVSPPLRLGRIATLSAARNAARPDAPRSASELSSGSGALAQARAAPSRIPQASAPPEEPADTDVEDTMPLGACAANWDREPTSCALLPYMPAAQTPMRRELLAHRIWLENDPVKQTIVGAACVWQTGPEPRKGWLVLGFPFAVAALVPNRHLHGKSKEEETLITAFRAVQTLANRIKYWAKELKVESCPTLVPHSPRPQRRAAQRRLPAAAAAAPLEWAGVRIPAAQLTRAVFPLLLLGLQASGEGASFFTRALMDKLTYELLAHAKTRVELNPDARTLKIWKTSVRISRERGKILHDTLQSRPPWGPKAPRPKLRGSPWHAPTAAPPRAT